MASLEEVFNRFANFGKSQQQSSASMDGKAFAKLCKDCKLLSPKFTTTDVDLIFANNKVKNKADRKIDFQQFLIAIELIAERKGVSVESVKDKIIATGGPETNNTQKAEATGIYDKLTNVSLYTGAHKSRFDVGGNAAMSSGRESAAKNYDAQSLRKTPEPTKSKQSTATKRPPSPARNQNVTKTQTGSGIFARLTDTSLYTGSHKHRFDSDGKGRGLAGRDIGGNGAGTHGGRPGDLSSMTRTNLN
jgi:hypothetical protein